MTKPKCKKCERNFKVLTLEKLCAYCHKDENGEWPHEFRGAKEKKKIIKSKK